MQGGYFFLLRTSLAMAFLTAVLGCGSDDRSSESSPDHSASAPPPIASKSPRRQDVDRAHPVVKVETSMGDVVVRLDAEKAVLTVDNFLQYVDQGQYEGTIFHQVDKGRAVLGGAYGKDLVEKTARVPVRNEADNGLKNRRGTIAMARHPSAIDSATRQFFFNLADNPELDHQDRTAEGYGYCVFGEVTQGMDVLERIGNVAVHDVKSPDGSTFQGTPVEPILIHAIRRAEP